MKRIIGFITVLAVILGCVSVSYADKAVGADEAEILAAIGVYTSSEVSPSITRADFAGVAARLLGGSEEEFTLPEKRLFADVDENTNNAGAINYLFSHGIIVGYGNAVFEPDRNLTCQEAVKILVSALGYEHTAEMYGGYYTGYLQIASSTGLLKGVTTGYDSDIDTGNLAVMIMNAMETEIVTVTINGTNVSMSPDEGVTLMGKYLDMGKYTGIVNGYDYTSLESEAKEYAKGTVSIGNMEFYCGRINAEKYLGMNVEAYYTEVDGDYTLVYLKDRKNTCADIDRNYIEKASVSEIEYYKTSDDLKTSKFKIAADAVYIYNGKKTVMIADNDLYPNCGSLRLIDNNGDSKADVVIINDYSEVIVSSVLSTERKVITKYDNKTLDFDDDEILFYVGDAEAEFSDIAKTSILNIAESKNSTGRKITRVIITDEAVTGSIRAFTKGEDKVTVSVDGNDYEFSVQFGIYNGLGKTAYPSAGDTEYEFRLNMEGRIADFKMATGGRKYAYVIRNWLDDEEEIRYIKMYTSDGEFLKIPMREKLSVNGTKTDSLTLSLENEQLIVYEVDSEDKLSKIETAIDKRSETYYIAKDEEFVLHFRSELVQKTQPDGTVAWVYPSQRFYKTFAENKPYRFMKGKTIYFQIPEDKTSEKDYKIISDLGSTDIGVKGPISIYDAKEGGIIGAMIAGELGGSDSYATPQMVDNVSSVLNEDDEACTQINFIGGSSVIVSPDVKFVQPSSSFKSWAEAVDYSNVGLDDLTHGDVIQYVVTGGYADTIMVLVRAHDVGGVRSADEYLAKNGNIVGKVMSIDDKGTTGIIYYKDRYNKEWYQSMQLGGTVLKYDSSTNKGSYTTASDIREGDTVLINSFWWSIKATFIFR